MTAFIDILMTIGVFVAGLAARLGVVLGIALLLLAPVLLALGAGKVFRSARMWMEGYRSAGHLRFRGGLGYAPGHTWVKSEGKALKVGIDDLAQRILPWTVAVGLPREGQVVKEGEPVATLSCGDRQVRIAAPTAGRIVAVNAEVLREPTLAKSENCGTDSSSPSSRPTRNGSACPSARRPAAGCARRVSGSSRSARSSWAWRRPTAASSSAPPTPSSATPSGRICPGASCTPRRGRSKAGGRQGRSRLGGGDLLS